MNRNQTRLIELEREAEGIRSLPDTNWIVRIGKWLSLKGIQLQIKGIMIRMKQTP